MSITSLTSLLRGLLVGRFARRAGLVVLIGPGITFKSKRSLTLGNRVMINTLSVIGRNVTIGDHSSVGRNTYIDNEVRIGSRVRISPNGSLLRARTPLTNPIGGRAALPSPRLSKSVTDAGLPPMSSCPQK